MEELAEEKIENKCWLTQVKPKFTPWVGSNQERLAPKSLHHTRYKKFDYIAGTWKVYGGIQHIQYTPFVCDDIETWSGI